jgi:hypothetical protein
MCLKDWFDAEIKDHDHSNMYDISEYDMSIFFLFRTTLFFFDFFIYFSNLYLKFIEFVHATSVDMYLTRTHFT